MTQVAQAIFGHLWLALGALGIPVSIVLNAMARAVAERIRTSTSIACGNAEDQWLKDLGVSAADRCKRAIERLDRDRASR
jgi:hypothetical protein